MAGVEGAVLAKSDKAGKLRTGENGCCGVVRAWMLGCEKGRMQREYVAPLVAAAAAQALRCRNTVHMRWPECLTLSATSNEQ
jgi:hypothetical protein